MTFLRSPVSLLVFLCLAGCSRGEVREWSPSDHDQEPGAAPASSRGTPRPPAADVQAQVADVAWSRQCASCHGPEGRGDGPNGPMVKAPDLSRPDWQAATSDEQIAAVIREGRNKMPRFDLPPAVINVLVRRIRSLRGR